MADYNPSKLTTDLRQNVKANRGKDNNKDDTIANNAMIQNRY